MAMSQEAPQLWSIEGLETEKSLAPRWFVCGAERESARKNRWKHQTNRSLGCAECAHIGSAQLLPCTNPISHALAHILL